MRMAQARAGMSQEAASVALEGLKKDYEQFVAAIKTGNMAIIDGGNQFGAFGQKVYGARRRIQKFGSSVGQQVGYQVQDFFVQIQSGTDVMVALGQQGSQLAGVFGTKGALLGAVIAIGTAIGGIAIAAYKSMQGLQDLKDTLDELASAQSSLKEILNLLEQSPVQIAENFTMAIEKVQQYLAILAKADMQTIKQQAGTTISSASSFLKTPVGLQLPPEVIAKRFGITPDRDLIEQVGGVIAGETYAQFSREQLELIEEYRTLAKEVLNAASPVEASDAFLRLEQVVLALGVAAEDLPEGFITAKNELAKFAFEYDQAAATAIKVNKALDKGIQASTENVDALRERIEKERLRTVRRAEDAIEAARKKRRDSARREDQRDLNKLSETEKLRRRLQDDRLRTFRRAEDVIESVRKRRRDAARREEQRDLNRLSETEQLRRRLQDRSTRIIQEAEKRHRIRRRKEEEEAARLRAREETRIQEKESQRRIKNITERVKKDAIPPFDPRALGFDKVEAEAYKLQNDLESNSIDFDKRRTDRLMREYAKVGKARIAYNNTVAEEQAERDQETLKRQEAAEQSLARLQNGRFYASRAYNSEIIQASQERTAGELAAQQRFLEGIQEALQEGQKLSELDMKSPYDSALLSAKELAELMKISLSEALTIINAIEQAKTGPVSGGRGRTLPTASDILMMGMGGEYIPSDKTDKPSGKTDYQKLLEDYSNYITGLEFETKVQSQLIGLFDEERYIQEQLIRAKEKYAALGKVFNEQEIEQELRKQEELRKTQEVLEENRRRQQELADAMEGHFEDAFMSFVDHTKTAEEKFKEFASAVIKDLYRILVVQNMVNAAKMAFSGGGGPLAFLGNLFADGAAFSKGSVVPFATGGVVGSPTYFPMSGGRTGLMGEAGPEAIMPLKRGKDGKLGVASEGTSDTIVVNNSFNFAANGDDSVKRIITQSMPQITEAAKAGVLDARKRGGQFRKVFS